MRIFSAPFENLTLSLGVDYDLIQIANNANVTAKLIAFHMGQSSDAGDAEAELLRWSIMAGYGATVGSGGTALTEQNIGRYGNTPQASVLALNDTIALAGAGSLVTKHGDTFHVAAGLHWEPPEPMWIPIAPSDFLVIRLPVGPADALTVDGTVWWGEEG